MSTCYCYNLKNCWLISIPSRCLLNSVMCWEEKMPLLNNLSKKNVWLWFVHLYSSISMTWTWRENCNHQCRRCLVFFVAAGFPIIMRHFFLSFFTDVGCYHCYHHNLLRLTMIQTEIPTALITMWNLLLCFMLSYFSYTVQSRKMLCMLD